ncbi:DUF5671 domain-containing protein [Agromyces sp. SYSU T0242]|uniref:DUF5671 domain-containing protein n=1 Tax=Agromyces litoreus TaxID=3158561 RepID=UPI003393EE68
MSAGRGSAQSSVRRIIVFVLLFVLVAIAAIGIGGLLDRLLDTDPELVSGGAADLALSLAFALIGGPLAALLWWATWRRLGDPDERGAVSWGLYLAAMLTVSLIVATAGIAGALAGLAVGRWEPSSLATGVAWLLVWLWHRWMLAHAAKGPTRLAGVAPVLGAAYGLVVTAVGTAGALTGLFDAALRAWSDTAIVGATWWRAAAGGLAWAAVGAAVWWWHWVRDRVRDDRTAFAGVVLVVVGILGGAAATLAGLTAALLVVLRLAFDAGDGPAVLVEPLGGALAIAAVGGIVWRLHAGVAAGRDGGVRRAARLVVSGLGLAFAASGIGVVVNAALAALADPIAATGTRALLLGGISALVVGGPTWWLAWRPMRAVDPSEAADVGRRVYLVAVFGASAIVAIVTLIVIGYRLFESALDPVPGSELLDRVRAPIGLLVATALVFGVHFATWRRDRAAAASAEPGTVRRIGRVVLVAAGDAAPLARAIADATGAAVTTWPRVPVDGEDGAPVDPARVVAALEDAAARRVLVLAGPGERVDVVPLVE